MVTKSSRDKRATTNVASAYSVRSSKTILSDDGLWPTFELDVGAGPGGSQVFYGVVSTSSYGIWLPSPFGCGQLIPGINITYKHKPAECPPARGIGLYNARQNDGYNPRNSTAASPTYSGLESLFIYPPLSQIPALNTSAYAGSDRVQLQSLTFDNTSISSVLTLQPLLSVFGIGIGVLRHPWGTQTPSPVLSLVQSGRIPSKSWAHTAGATYADRSASLVLGGYDANRINGSSTAFNMSEGDSLQVQVSSMSLGFSNGSAAVSSVFPPFSAVIDSTVPYLYLPNSTIDWLKTRLHLYEYGGTFYYNTSDLFSQAAITGVSNYTIAVTTSDANATETARKALTLNLDFPAAAFTPIASWVYNFTAENLTIAPIRRQAAGVSQAILGRAFLQEAYLIADFERKTFNLSQTTYAPSTEAIVNICNTTFDCNGPGSSGTRDSSSANSLAPGAIAGIVIGAIFGIVAIATILWILRKRRRVHKEGQDGDEKPSSYEKAELEGRPADAKEPMSEMLYEAGTDFNGTELDVPYQPLPPAELEGDNHIPPIELPQAKSPIE